MGIPIDMVFTYETQEKKMTLVQLRPLSSYEEMASVRIPECVPDKILLKGSRYGQHRNYRIVHPTLLR